MALYGLTEKDRAVIKAVVDEVRRFMVNPQSRPGEQGIDHQEHQAPEVYIAKATDTVPAMSGEEPGIGPCEIYRIIPVTGLVDRVGNLTYQVYNLSTTDVDADTWLVIQRDKFGQWVIKHAVGGEASFWARLTYKTYTDGSYTAYSWVRQVDAVTPTPVTYADHELSGDDESFPAYEVNNVDLPVDLSPADPLTGTGTGTGVSDDQPFIARLWPGVGDYYLFEQEPRWEFIRITSDETVSHGGNDYFNAELMRYDQITGTWVSVESVLAIDANAEV